MPTISVIVPVYNVEKYIHRCVDSILAQTFTDFELLLVDDGSADKSGSICDEYAMRTPKIEVIHKPNGGVSSARNAGIEHAKGQFIVFIDSDDYVEPDYLQQLQENVSDLTICGFICRTDRGQYLYEISPEAESFSCKEEIDYARLYRNLLLYSPYCKAFRRDIIVANALRFPQDISWGEDGMFVADYLKYVEKISVLSYKGYNYIRYPGESTLATKIRANIIDEIVKARTHVFQQIETVSPAAFQNCKTVCEEDIRNNCAYFVKRLICGEMPYKVKCSLLDRFLSNSYVRETVTNRKKYYADNPQVCASLKYNYASGILIKYGGEIFLRRMIHSMRRRAGSIRNYLRVNK